MRALRFLAAAACLLLLCAFASAEEGDFTWREQADGTVIITSWTGTGDQVTVPAALGGMPVSGIGNGVFANKTSLTVSLPDEMTSFQSNSFGYPPNMVNRIECRLDSTTAKSLSGKRFFDPDYPDFQFNWSSGRLQLVGYVGGAGEVLVPSPVQIIGTGVFQRKQDISVVLPDTVEQIYANAFDYGNGIKVYLPDNITKLGDRAFGASASTWATVYCRPDSGTAFLLTCPFRAPEAPACVLRWVDEILTLVDVDAAEGPVALPMAEVAIPAETLVKLPCFTLPGDLHTVESEAFRGCGENRIVIPPGVESIGAYAFADSPNLVMIRFPSGEIAIDDTCLANCPHVTVSAPAGSAALRWAQDRGLNTEEE